MSRVLEVSEFPSTRELAPLQLSKIEGHSLDAKAVSDVALPAIEGTEHPRSSDRLDPERVSSPSLAWEAMQAALAYEIHSNKKLDGHLKIANGYQNMIDALLDLSPKLPTPNGELKALSEEAKGLISDLKAKGVDLPEDADVLQLKSEINGRIDQLRSKLQTLVSTDIHTLMQNMNSIIDIMKEINKLLSRLLEAIIARYAR